MIESLAEERNQRIMESQKIVEKIKLKPCPFCGGTAQFKNPVNKGMGRNRRLREQRNRSDDIF